jgi:hypothetical protein
MRNLMMFYNVHCNDILGYDFILYALLFVFTKHI